MRRESLLSARQLLSAVSVHETEWASKLLGEEVASRKLHMALPSLTPDQQEEELARLQAGHTRPSITFLASPDLPVMGSLALVPEAASELEDDDLEEVMMDDIVEEEIKMYVNGEEESVKSDHFGEGGRGLELDRVTGGQKKVPARPSIYSSYFTLIENTRPPKVFCSICGATSSRKNFSRHMIDKHLPEETCSTRYWL